MHAYGSSFMMCLTRPNFLFGGSISGQMAYKAHMVRSQEVLTAKKTGKLTFGGTCHGLAAAHGTDRETSSIAEFKPITCFRNMLCTTVNSGRAFMSCGKMLSNQVARFVERAVRFRTPPGFFPRAHAPPLGRLGTRLVEPRLPLYSQQTAAPV
jgi:hypothetical protein